MRHIRLGCRTFSRYGFEVFVISLVFIFRDDNSLSAQGKMANRIISLCMMRIFNGNLLFLGYLFFSYVDIRQKISHEFPLGQEKPTSGKDKPHSYIFFYCCRH